MLIRNAEHLGWTTTPAGRTLSAAASGSPNTQPRRGRKSKAAARWASRHGGGRRVIPLSFPTHGRPRAPSGRFKAGGSGSGGAPTRRRVRPKNISTVTISRPRVVPLIWDGRRTKASTAHQEEKGRAAPQPRVASRETRADPACCCTRSTSSWRRGCVSSWTGLEQGKEPRPLAYRAGPYRRSSRPHAHAAVCKDLPYEPWGAVGATGEGASVKSWQSAVRGVLSPSPLRRVGPPVNS